MKSYLPFCSRMLATVMLILTNFNLLPAQVHYVKSDAAGLADGHSWTDAYNDIQSAIDAAIPGDSIWVASGVYLPSYLHLGDSARHLTFYVNKDVLLFGGFPGEAGTEGDFSKRNPKNNPTTLSGDIGIAGEDSDNTFHVLYLDHVSDTARVDGFIISKGNGLEGVGFEGYGAGIYNDANAGRSNPIIANCIIRDNIASEFGGGVVNAAVNGGTARPTFIQCSIIQNQASGGGGIGNLADTDGNVSPVLIGCNLSGNTAPTGQAGAMQCIAHSSVSSPMLINCIVLGNHSPTSQAINCFVTGTGQTHPVIINSAFSGNTGGAIRISDQATQSSSIKIRNSILWNNGFNHGLSVNGATEDVAFSLIQFGFQGEGNIGLDPLFVSAPPLLDGAHTEGDLHLLPGSPALDAGSNQEVPVGIVTDYDTNPRFINSMDGLPGTVDMGPFEAQAEITSTSETLPVASWKIYPNPVISKADVSFSEIIQNGEVQILDSYGHRIRRYALRDSATISMEMSDLGSGTYFIYLLSGKLHDVRKIIIP
jgi:Secretion system C-terminal sorting domain